MLGDGHLRIPRSQNENSSLSVHRNIKDLEYMKYQAEILSNLFTVGKDKISEIKRFDKRTDKIYYHCIMTTRSFIELTEIHKKWYPNGKKTVPKDLKLNKEIIANWFCDDGWVDKPSNHRCSINFATNGFSKEDVYFLTSLLRERYDVPIEVKQAYKKNQYYIYLSTHSSIKLMEDIDDIFPKSMSRKKLWNKEILDELKNDRSIYSYKESSEKRRKEILKFLVNWKNDSFVLNDLHNSMDSKLIGEYVANGLKRYLENYVDSGFLTFTREGSKSNSRYKFTITPQGKEYFSKQ
jgi:hypothetical protein